MKKTIYNVIDIFADRIIFRGTRVEVMEHLGIDINRFYWILIQDEPYENVRITR